jgi:hypothetical protein
MPCTLGSVDSSREQEILKDTGARQMIAINLMLEWTGRSEVRQKVQLPPLPSCRWEATFLCNMTGTGAWDNYFRDITSAVEFDHLKQTNPVRAVIDGGCINLFLSGSVISSSEISQFQPWGHLEVTQLVAKNGQRYSLFINFLTIFESKTIIAGFLVTPVAFFWVIKIPRDVVLWGFLGRKSVS